MIDLTEFSIDELNQAIEKIERDRCVDYWLHIDNFESEDHLSSLLNLVRDTWPDEDHELVLAKMLYRHKFETADILSVCGPQIRLARMGFDSYLKMVKHIGKSLSCADVQLHTLGGRKLGMIVKYMLMASIQ